MKELKNFLVDEIQRVEELAVDAEKIRKRMEESHEDGCYVATATITCSVIDNYITAMRERLERL